MNTSNTLVARAHRASLANRIARYDAQDARIAGTVARTAFRHDYRISATLAEEYEAIVADGDENNPTAVY